MQKKKLVLGLVAFAVVAVGWSLFRPERLFVNTTVNEGFADAATAKAAAQAPVLLSQGTFHKGAHETAGTASIFQTPDGKRVLRLTDFMTSNGPDVQVYLVAANDALDNDTVTKSGFVHVGALKGNIGDQNYELPAGVDLAKHRAVTIWCRRFGVNFGTAPLTLS
ncbi:MAG: DM13 domain-containing protein [bacterium]